MGLRRAIIASLLLVATVARAQNRDARPEEPNESQQRQESRAAFRRGVAALEKQKWTEARDDFVRAYELFPHPSILLDLGLSRSHVGEWVQAEQDLTRFLADDTGALPDELQTARGALTEVRRHVGTIRVRVAPAGSTASLDHKPIALASSDFVEVRVSEGDHELEATASDHDVWSGHVAVDGGGTKVLDLTLTPHVEKETPHGPGPQRIASFVLFGGAVALAGFGVFAGVHSIDLANQYNTPSETNYQNPGTKSEGIAYRTAADVTFIVAGVCVVTGVVLYVTAPSQKTGASVSLSPFGIAGRF